MLILIKENKYFLITLFLMSFFLRFSFFLYFIDKNNTDLLCRNNNCWVYTDSREYTDIANNLYNNFENKKADGDYNFRRLPGYPVFLFLCYKVFNTINLKKALYIQIILASFIPVLMFVLSLILFPQNILLAKISAIFASINLGFIFYSSAILSESLFIFFLILFFINFYKSLYFLSGLFLGIASLIRPVGVYLVILSIILILFFNNLKIKNNIKFIFIFFLTWAFIISFWLIRNFLLTGYIFFHTLPGIHFLIYTASYIDSDINKISYSQSRSNLLQDWDKKIKLKEQKLNRKLLDIESCILAENIALDYIKNNKFLFIKHSFIQALKTCFSLHSTNLILWDLGLEKYMSNYNLKDRIKLFLFPRLNKKFLLILIYLEEIIFLLILLGFLGFIISSIINKIYIYELISSLFFIFIFIFLTLAYGCARLRLPIEVFMIIFSIKFWLSFKIKS